MKRFSFNTFLAADGNRAALDTCKRIAELEPVAPMPVLLLGEEGCGKTHLLYSIWKRVKASSPRTSLAVVTAREFRSEVRDLIGDPSPVEKAESAILLIDQLELFDDLLEELEAVVRIFLDNHHHVLMASNVHPRRLKALPQGLRDMISAGQIVEIRLREGETQLEILKREMRQESQAVIEKQRVEIEQLRELLERVGAAEAGSGEASGLRQALEEERARTAELAGRLEETTAVADSLKHQLDSLESKETVARLEQELETARNEAENLRQEVERRKDAEEQVEQLRQALEDAQAEKERDRADTLTIHEDERRRFEEEKTLLQQQLEAAQKESAQARHEANMLLERAEKLVGQIEDNQSRFRETEQEQRRQIEELEALVAIGGASEESDRQLADLQNQLAEAQVRLDAATSAFDEERLALTERLARSEEQLEEAVSQLRGQADETQRSLEQVSSERDRLTEALAAAEREREELRQALDTLRHERDELESALQQSHAEHENLRQSLEEAHHKRDELQAALDESGALLESVQTRLRDAEERLVQQSAEMEALRRDAAAQVAEANDQAGVLEGRLAQLQARLTRSSEAGHEAARRLEEIGPALMASVSTLDELRQHLRIVDGESPETDTAAEDTAWDTPSAHQPETPPDTEDQAGQDHEEPAAPEEEIDSGSLDEDQFDDDRMVLPPAPDEEDIDPGATEPREEVTQSPSWDGGQRPENFELPETPMGPLKDLSPLEDEPQ